MKRMTREERASRMATIRRVLRYLRRYWPLMALSLALAAVTVALTLYVPVLTGDAVDQIVGPGQVGFAAVGRIALTIGVLVGVTALAQWIMSVCNNRVTYCVVRDIRRDAFRRINELPLSYIDSHAHGELVSRVIADVEQFADGLLMGFTQLFTGVLTILGTLGFMVAIRPVIALVVVLITPVSFLVAAFVARRTYDMFRLQSEERGAQTALIDEMVTGQRVVQAFGQEQAVQARFDAINARLEKASCRATFFSSITNPATRFVNSLVYAGVGLSGALLAVGGSFSVGNLVSFLSYANQYTKPFNEISGVVTELQNAVACAERILSLIEDAPRVQDAPDAQELTAPDGRVELSHVSFSYRKDRPLIEDLNLSVSRAQRVAIVGPTGCGKTTVINLLMRFYDVDGGSIAVSGRDIRTLTRRSLRSAYGMVAPGDVAQERHRAREHRLWQARGDGGGDRRRRKGRPCGRLHPPPAAGVRYRDRRGRRQPLAGAEAAAVHQPRHAAPAAHAHPRRGDQLHRHPHRAQDPGCVRPPHGGAHELHRRAPPVHHPQRGRDPRHARRTHRGVRHARGAARAQRLLCGAVQQPVRQITRRARRPPASHPANPLGYGRRAPAGAPPEPAARVSVRSGARFFTGGPRFFPTPRSRGDCRAFRQFHPPGFGPQGKRGGAQNQRAGRAKRPLIPTAKYIFSY